jgi:peptide/nickel transport system substrate-binding protein
MKKKVHAHLRNPARRSFLQCASWSLAGIATAGMPAICLATPRDELHYRNYQDVLSFDPVSSVSAAEGLLFSLIYQNLLRFGPDGTWGTQNDAAEYVRQASPTRYDFRLKPGQLFSDGFGEMTADDVRFSFERILDPAMHALNLPDLGPLDHVEVHDRYSGTFVLRAPYAAFLTVGLAGPNGAILSRKAVTSAGGRFTTDPPCFSGPYRLKSWQAQRKTVFVRNPEWTGQPAPFSAVHVYAMSDDKAAEMAYEAGQLDCSQISVETVGPFRRDTPPDSSIRVLPSGRNYWLGINRENTALQDIRVRRAIQYAIDVEAILEASWFGLASVSTGPIPEGMTGHRPQALVPAKGDPERARALLEEAGIALPLRLRLDITNRVREMTTAQVVQWSLKKVGIEVDIRAGDNSTFLTIGMEQYGDQWRDVQLFLQDFVGLADPYYSMTWFTSDQVGIWNWERFSNAEFDHLNQLAMETGDTAARSRMYRRMQDLMEESGCYRFITNGVMPQIVRDSIEPVFRPDGYALLRDFRPGKQAG